jgi:hypothetical protein
MVNTARLVHYEVGLRLLLLDTLAKSSPAIC